MKKQLKLTILTLVLGLMSLTTVSAQSTFKKSEKFVEGTVSYTKEDGSKAEWSLNPTVGYFLTDKFAVGLTGGFGESADVKTTNIGAFGRCYFLNIGKSAKIYSQLGVASNSTNTAGVKVSSTMLDLGLGANYFVTSKLALTMHVADLVSYQTQDSNSQLSVGFAGVTNPFALANFGVLYKF